MIFGTAALHPVIDLAFAIFTAFLMGSLSEYWVHRLMHTHGFKKDIHEGHHILGFSQGVWPEFWVYYRPALPFVPAGFLLSTWAGIGGILGSLAFALFAAVSHQLSHERPSLLIWQRTPVHHLHHRHDETEYNFGISTEIWDHVFGTFRAHEFFKSELPFIRTLSEISWKMPPDAEWWENQRAVAPIQRDHPALNGYKQLIEEKFHEDGGIGHLSSDETLAFVAALPRQVNSTFISAN